MAYNYYVLMVLGQLFCILAYPYTLWSCVVFLLLRWSSFL